MTWMQWYESLAKPAWTPSPPMIGLIWQILYPVIFVTFGFVFVQAFWRKVPWWLGVMFATNLVANLIFMPILAEEVVRRGPSWRCTLIGGVLEEECNGLFEAVSRRK